MHVVLGGGAGGGKRRGKHGEYTGSGWQECVGKRNDFLETKELEKGTGEPARTSVVDLCVTACSRHIVATSSPPTSPTKRSLLGNWRKRPKRTRDPKEKHWVYSRYGMPIPPQRTDATETGGVWGDRKQIRRRPIWNGGRGLNA